MKKYVDSLVVSITHQLEQWLDQPTLVDDEEVYRFLHSLKGTAATIGLHELTNIAEVLQNELARANRKQWRQQELREFLYAIVRLTDDYQVNQEMSLTLDEQKSTRHSHDNTPLLLIVDRDITLLMFLKEELEKLGWDVLTTADPDKAVSYFLDLHPDCLITGLYTPHATGFQLIEVLRQKIKRLSVPIIVISADQDKPTRLNAYRKGADDFLAKPLDMEELIVHITRQLERKKALDTLLFVDELTGAFNRNYLEEVFDRHHTEFKRTGQPFSIALLELDHLKTPMETAGLPLAYNVLIAFKKFMKRSMRGTDVLIRFDREEFAIILPNTPAPDAKHIMEQLLEGFCQYMFESSSGSVTVTFSAGVVEVQHKETSLERLLKKAAEAMRNGKQEQNRVEIADSNSSLSLENRRKVKVAILDDVAIIRTMLAENVRSLFNEQVEPDIRTFGNGAAFFQDPWSLGQEPYLVILDGVMPQMDGLEVLRRLRSMPTSSHYKIVMLTGRKNKEDIYTALQYGVEDYITKPFSIGDLQARIKRLVQYW